MTRPVAVLACVLAAAACGREPESAPVTPASAEERRADDLAKDYDRDNLLSITRGASVVSRTSEMVLEFSAVQAIDSMSDTYWSAPPGTARATLVFSLGTPTRVEALGATTWEKTSSRPHLEFETSADGRNWRQALSFTPDKKDDIRKIAPVDAGYIRVVLSNATEPPAVRSIQARGRALSPPDRPAFGGCWEINGSRAMFSEDRARITGVIEGKVPTYVEGGIDGRTGRLMWRRGPSWGYAVLTTTLDGGAITGLVFHEDPAAPNYGRSWMGTRCRASVATAAAPDPSPFLDRGRAWALFGIVFDANGKVDLQESAPALDAVHGIVASSPQDRFRIVAREYGLSDAARDLRVSTERLEAVRAALAARGDDARRIEFVARGREPADADSRYSVQRVLRSRLDLERISPSR